MTTTDHIAITSPDAKGRFNLYRWLTKAPGTSSNDVPRYKVFPAENGGIRLEPIYSEAA